MVGYLSAASVVSIAASFASTEVDSLPRTASNKVVRGFCEIDIGMILRPLKNEM